MSCVSSASFAVLINEEATEFFKSSRGIRQGCPLSPCFSFSHGRPQLDAEKQSGDRYHFRGIKVTSLIKVLHILFVDDVVIMSKASFSEWTQILSLINIFCDAAGLSINPTKTFIYFEGLSEAELIPFKSLLPFSFCAL